MSRSDKRERWSWQGAIAPRMNEQMEAREQFGTRKRVLARARTGTFSFAIRFVKASSRSTARWIQHGGDP
jgi:hypothetical protein